jgi:hypothetical protein
MRRWYQGRLWAWAEAVWQRGFAGQEMGTGMRRVA